MQPAVARKLALELNMEFASSQTLYIMKCN